ncbi:MAG: NAD(P)H-dependent oxidoreductase [Betaproteobacteria bacterium]|nr:NAD(P)H-dependent oxidoreductase [Betaproteobacteria bacterium]
MNEPHDVAVIIGSLRKASYNRKIAQALAELAPARLKLEIVEIAQLPLYSQDYDEATPTEYAPFRERIARADAVLFVTPEHNRSMPAALKNALDVASRPPGQNKWAGKPAGVVTASIAAIGGFGANHHLRQSLTFLDMPTLQQPEAYIGKVQDLLDPANGKLNNDSTREFLRKFMDRFAAWIERVVPSDRQ